MFTGLIEEIGTIQKIDIISGGGRQIKLIQSDEELIKVIEKIKRTEQVKEIYIAKNILIYHVIFGLPHYGYDCSDFLMGKYLSFVFQLCIEKFGNSGFNICQDCITTNFS